MKCPDCFCDKSFNDVDSTVGSETSPRTGGVVSILETGGLVIKGGDLKTESPSSDRSMTPMV